MKSLYLMKKKKKMERFFKRGGLVCLIFLVVGICPASRAFSADTQPKMVLTDAMICQGIENFQPVNPAVVFSIDLGEVFCYSSFDPVHETTYIYHKWYKRDKLIFTMRLTLSPPKWSSFSRIQIRGADKGPWRVEIQDENAKVLKTLRFSMTD